MKPGHTVYLVAAGKAAWQMAAAAITGFIAKENVVGTIAVCYGITNFIDTEELALSGGAAEVAAVFLLLRSGDSLLPIFIPISVCWSATVRVR